MTTTTLRSVRPLCCPLGAIILPLALGGCPSPDAQGKFDRFNEQTEDDREMPEPKMDFGVMPDLAEPLDLDGVFLLAVSTAVNPPTPLQFIAEVDAELDLAGNGTIAANFQPLSLDVGSVTEPREEVGNSIDLSSDVTEFGFVLDFGEIMVTGAANPITGSDIVSQISLTGRIQDADGWCGTATGEVSSPLQLPLEGSTFAAIRLADRGERPLEFPMDCEGNMPTSM